MKNFAQTYRVDSNFTFYKVVFYDRSNKLTNPLEPDEPFISIMSLIIHDIVENSN